MSFFDINTLILVIRHYSLSIINQGVIKSWSMKFAMLLNPQKSEVVQITISDFWGFMSETPWRLLYWQKPIKEDKWRRKAPPFTFMVLRMKSR